MPGSATGEKKGQEARAMRLRFRRCGVLGLPLLLAAGCASTDAIPAALPAATIRSNDLVRNPDRNSSTIVAAAAEVTEESPSQSGRRPRPAYAQLETLPIDLPTVLRLIDEQNPAIEFARARVAEAQARVRGAEVQWLPHLTAGAAYNRFDGQTQNQRGELFGVSRANLFAGGGPALTLDFAEAIYRPLIERRVAAAEQFRERAVLYGTELEGVTAYLDLIQCEALMEINGETLQRAEAMLQSARNAKDQKLDRTAGDVNRAMTEVLFRRAERIELQGKAAAASARLGRLLLLPPNVKLVPADAAIAPVTLIDPTCSLDQLIEIATTQRPDLAAHREAIAAAWARVRRQERGPLYPKLAIVNQTGSFGGGLNDDLAQFHARNALSVQLAWELRNLGFGNRAEANERRAQVDQAFHQLRDAQARAAADIVEAAQIAAARYESLELAEQAVKEATELYRIQKEGIFNVVDAKNLFDALRPLQAIQVLNQARQNYLGAVMDFNRSQYRLFALLGHPTREAVTASPVKRPSASPE